VSSEVIQQPEYAVNPATGEALELATADTDVIAGIRRGVIDLKRALDDYATFLDAELNRRLDRMNMRSAVVGAYVIETKAPSKVEYPPEALREALTALVEAGKIEADVVTRTVVAEPVSYKVDRREVNKLLKHQDEDVRKAVEAAGVDTPQRRPVKIGDAAA
jgi:ribosomal protein L25 (general stress protein Ctc)